MNTSCHAHGYTCIILLVAAVFSSHSVEAQPSPEDFLGYELGDRFTPHHQIVSYFNEVSGESDRIELLQYGESYEQRPLKAAFISSAENIERLEEIRLNNKRLAGLEDGEPDLDAPAIVWLSYNIHGNESSSSEVSMRMLHSLASADERADEWLENTVVVIDPGLNPDGRERYINWYTQTAGVDADPRLETREHHEPWPGGRSNHYYFDLNRDWAWQTQQETRYRTDLYLKWYPHIHVDFHEMGHNSPYYFAPAAEPFHEDITQWQEELQTIIGENHTRYFDDDYRLYYTREVFDLFYPSYGDTWPTFNGAIGMTYEQAGHGQAGRSVITEEGDTLTLADRIHNHHTVSLSTVEVASQQQQRIVEEFHNYHRSAEEDPPGEYNTWLLRGDNHPDKLQNLLSYLDRNHIAYGYADPPRRNQDAHNYKTGEPERIEIREDDIVIPAHQPKSRLAKVLMEPETEIVDSLTYDITGWSLPYAYGLEAYAVSSQISLRDEEVHFPDYGAPEPEEPPYAYIARWETIEDARFLSAISDYDIRLRVAKEPFVMNDETYAPGTLVLTRRGNEHMGNDFDEIIQHYAGKLERNLDYSYTGFADEGIDFGSNNMRLLEWPEVALISGDGVNSGNFGEMRHLFEQQLNYPVAVINKNQVSAEILREYDVVIMADGNYDNNNFSTVVDWVNEGGRLIAMGNSVSNLAGRNDLENLQLKTPQDLQQTTGDHTESRGRRYADRQREAISEAVRGSIYRVQVDSTHPLGFGYPDYYYTLKNNTIGLEANDTIWSVGYLEEGARLNGFAGHEARKNFENSMVFGSAEIGAGNLLMFTDSPDFRSFWYNGKLLIANAVFMSGL